MEKSKDDLKDKKLSKIHLLRRQNEKSIRTLH